ncbi:MAG: hybrid sensor histidine kinase/response regulator transcription factor, partial [Cyclobacteriaceae bacterium]
ITLTHAQNDLTFEYVGIHYGNSSENQYKYKLEPYDLTWNEAGTQRMAHYRNLDPGAYTFRVIGSNDNDVWDEQGASLQLLIKTAWWSRWWAYLLYISFFCFIAYTLHRFQLSRKLALEESERQKQLNQLKSDLYTNISHEFRTPLTVILGMTDSLKSQLNSSAVPAATKKIEMIRRNSENLLTLVNEMLYLSKLESGHIQTDQVQINVLPFIKYLGESFNSLSREKHIDFTVFSEIDELVMDVDTRKLSGILSNLLSNAIKFTPPLGKVQLHLCVENDSKLIIKVCDSGSGISKEDQPYIFNRFYQARTNRMGTEKGTGIGLAIAREMTSELGGHISVESSPGNGSVFTVSLPVTHNAPKIGTGSLNLSPDGCSKPTDNQIWEKVMLTEDPELPLALIIEDNNDVACYIAQCLAGRYNIIYAPDGNRGLEMAFKFIPDIVISDVMMPGKNGFDVCSALKKDELTDHIPIIMLTAKVALQDRLSGLSRGADAYLVKPFVKDELLTRIEHLIQVRQKLIQKFEGTGFGQVTQKRKTDPESKFIQKAIACINKHMSDPAFGPTQLATGLSLSESQVYRKLKAISGKSTAIFIRAVRLQKAKSLLQSTDLNISEIAYEVGFTNLAWFSSTFKKEFGGSPTAIRK